MSHLIPKSARLTPSAAAVSILNEAIAKAQTHFILPFTGNCSWVWGAAWKKFGFFYSISAGKGPQTSCLTLTVLLMVHTAGLGAETGGSSSRQNPQNPPFFHLTRHQLMLLLWHLRDTLCQALKLCRPKEEEAAIFACPTAGAQLTCCSYFCSQQQPKPVWGSTLGSLNITSMKADMFWEQFKITRGVGFFKSILSVRIKKIIFA